MGHDSEEYSDFNIPHNQLNFSTSNNKRLPNQIGFSSMDQQINIPQMSGADLVMLEESVYRLE